MVGLMIDSAVLVLAFARTTSGSGDRSLPINPVGALFERRGETLEGCVEHRAHQQGQHPALEFVSDIKPYLAGIVGLWLEGPTVFELAERPAQIFDQNVQIGTVQRHATCEGFADQLERDRHVAITTSVPLGPGLRWRIFSDWHNGTNSG